MTIKVTVTIEASAELTDRIVDLVERIVGAPVQKPIPKRLEDTPPAFNVAPRPRIRHANGHSNITGEDH